MLLSVEQAFVGSECNPISPKNDCVGGYPDLRSTPIIPLQNDYQYPGFTSLVPVSTSLGRE